jgi:hypothetical protein
MNTLLGCVQWRRGQEASDSQVMAAGAFIQRATTTQQKVSTTNQTKGRQSHTEIALFTTGKTNRWGIQWNEGPAERR